MPMQIDAGAAQGLGPAEIVRPALARLDAAAALRLAEALQLEPAQAERLASAVRAARRPPAVAASLLGLAPDEEIARAAAALYGAPLWDGAMDDLPGSVAGLNERFLAENHALVLADGPDRLIVGLVDPGAAELRRGVEYAAGRAVEFRTISFDHWRAASHRGFAGAAIDGAAGAQADAERLRDFASDAPVIRYLDGVLERALSERASDLHFEQKADRCVVRLRIDGALRDLEPISTAFGAGVIARAKVLADLDVASTRAPQDGRATLSLRGRPTDLRISTTPTVEGESAVLRILTRQGVDFTLGSLGFDPPLMETFQTQLRRPYGLILVTGPTGSGKTTTLYAALRRLATRDRKVLTIEDPIEYVFDAINQTQVNEAAGVTFASALRAFLRHDPDVILVGEIRDAETARLAIQAALTGHLVLATLHANDAAGAPARLADLGVERYLLAGVLIGVSAQRLVPKLCERCAVPHAASSREVEIFEAHGFSRSGLRLRTAPGCPACGGAGRAGRLPLGEIFTIDETMERLISAGAPTADLKARLAASDSFHSLTQDALRRAAAGEVSPEDAFRTVGL
ncbi:MAG TPA: GspE/PulE family protein [Caulobacteraceae bacterium]|nr:GspE/PulE family protein [Caulobacteraceae bacterium]